MYKQRINDEENLCRRKIFQILFEEILAVCQQQKTYGSHHKHVYTKLMIQ